MLEAAGVPFQVADAPLEEEALKARLGHLDAISLAGALAEAKARSVAAGPGCLILGCDQILEREDGTILNKPSSRDDARAQLQSLSGTTHRLHSAAVVVEKGVTSWRHTQSASLTMRSFSASFLEDYLDREFEKIRWGVGGYRIEGPGIQLFEAVEGSHFAILGLPLIPLLAFLRTRSLLPS